MSAELVDRLRTSRYWLLKFLVENRLSYCSRQPLLRICALCSLFLDLLSLRLFRVFCSSCLILTSRNGGLYFAADFRCLIHVLHPPFGSRVAEHYQRLSLKFSNRNGGCLEIIRMR